MMMEKKNNAKPSTRMLVLFCLIGVGLIVTAVIELMAPDCELLAMLTLQDVLAFIAPAVRDEEPHTSEKIGSERNSAPFTARTAR